MTPDVVIRPIRFPMTSVNQRFPSGPTVMVSGWLFAFGRGNSVTTPAGVMRPIALQSSSANHRFPSGPVTMPSGVQSELGSGNSVMT